ncbi:hypothetical protein [Evansella cellulosilytica]|uniref:DUF1499 domain-containing protein n=1 Tax=Evansella cellulosilytica (strain ATCC 21833 / DSM 2522 / FERM P-1141 / JCM 9156 / N-4) TaxID=649639 RepID=E6U0K5_EVAC2|nr:hypothetical protein [Evansella cellulosilytica]ADU31450.1 hypothetical protein Bcell_3208 [Evansella cellulosilytica DSM 2522]
MGIIQKAKLYLGNHTETKENHFDEKLRTRYYKAMKDKVIAEIEGVINQRQGYEIARVEEDRGEVIVKVKKGKKKLIVFTVIMVRPNKTAVDISVDTDTVLFTDFGHSRHVIYGIYEDLDKRLTFIGSGLGDELIKY